MDRAGAAKDFLDMFQDDLRDEQRSLDLYSALCNNVWKKEDRVLDFSWRAAGEFIASIRNELNIERVSPDTCRLCRQKKIAHKKTSRQSYFSLLEKEFEIEEWLCENGQNFMPGRGDSEDYLDFYCSGEEGAVKDWVMKKFNQTGYNNG